MKLPESIFLLGIDLCGINLTIQIMTNLMSCELCVVIYSVRLLHIILKGLERHMYNLNETLFPFHVISSVSSSRFISELLSTNNHRGGAGPWDSCAPQGHPPP